MQYATRDRKVKKRTFRALWIQRLNAAVRELGIPYSRFIDGLNKAGIEMDRKVLSELAIHEPAAFAAIVEKAKGRVAGLIAQACFQNESSCETADYVVVICANPLGRRQTVVLLLVSRGDRAGAGTPRSRPHASQDPLRVACRPAPPS